MGLPVRKGHELFTYADYLSWPVEEDWELIEGGPFDMSPALSPYYILGERQIPEILRDM
jgi:hypothetical protein